MMRELSQRAAHSNKGRASLTKGSGEEGRLEKPRENVGSGGMCGGASAAASARSSLRRKYTF